MTRKQLVGLLLPFMIPFLVGNSVLVLLPLHMQTLGAEASTTGVFLAIAFAALAAGTMSGGWLSQTFQRRKQTILLSAALSIPIMLWLNTATAIWQIALGMTVIWFLSGVQLSMVNILTGLYAPKDQRGRTFGLLNSGRVFTQLLGGLYAGWVVDHWGFSTLFLISAAAYLLTVLGALLLEDKPAPVKAKAATAGSTLTISRTFWLLFWAWLLVNTVNFVMSLGKPLTMSARGFDNTAISSTLLVAGLLNLPLPFVLGWLSDRWGRRSVLMLSYLGGTLGMLFLANGTDLWHFWAAQVMISFIGSGAAVGAALVTDVVAPEDLSASLARYDTARWLGAVVGFSGTGIAIQQLGLNTAFMLGASIPLIAIALIVSIYAPRLPMFRRAAALS